jgi:hypothetical protein
VQKPSTEHCFLTENKKRRNTLCFDKEMSDSVRVSMHNLVLDIPSEIVSAFVKAEQADQIQSNEAAKMLEQYELPISKIKHVIGTQLRHTARLLVQHQNRNAK